MITERGKVTKVDDQGVWVETIRQSTCGACQARHGCGQRLLNQIGIGAPSLRAQANPSVTDLTRGEWVEIGVEEGAVVVGSLLAYGLPVSLLVLGAAFGGDGTVAAAAGAIGGLLLGVLVSRYLLENHLHAGFFQAKVLSRAQDEQIVSLTEP